MIHASLKAKSAKALALIAFLLALLLLHSPAHAQVFPCSGQPGEYMVGEQPGGNGIAPTPLCQMQQEAPQQQQQQQQGPSYAAAAPGVHGAIAIDEGSDQYMWVYGQHGIGPATSSAMVSCVSHGGKSCRVILAFEGDASLVSDWEGRYFTGTDPYSGAEAIRKAFASCNEQSHTGGCTLQSPPVLYGAVDSPKVLSAVDVLPLLYGKDWSKKGQVNPREADELGGNLDALSARLDTRIYWGAVASNGNNIQTSYNRPDQDAAESMAMKQCDGCKIVQIFKNTCAGIAWPKDNKPVYETALDNDPASAKQKALAQCTGKYGECEVRARCSGRQYAQANPDAPPSKPAAPAATP